MPWIAAAVLCILLFAFPKKAALLLSVLAGAASLLWGGIWAYNTWQNARISRIEIVISLPEYPQSQASDMPVSWKKSGKEKELRELWTGPLSENEKRRSANSMVHGCDMDAPLLASIYNGNADALLRYGIAVEAYQDGRSTNLASHYQTVLDIIIGPGERKTLCIPAPRLKGGVSLNDVVFKSYVFDPLFD